MKMNVERTLSFISSTRKSAQIINATTAESFVCVFVFWMIAIKNYSIKT